MAKVRVRGASRAARAGARVRALPWVVVLQGAIILGERWRALSDRDRARLSALMRESRGRLGNLSSRERKELSGLMRKLDLMGAGRELVPLVRRGRKRR